MKKITDEILETTRELQKVDQKINRADRVRDGAIDRSASRKQAKVDKAKAVHDEEVRKIRKDHESRVSGLGVARAALVARLNELTGQVSRRKGV